MVLSKLRPQGEAVFRDLQFPVMAIKCSKVKIRDFDKPNEITLSLDGLLPQRSN